MATSVYETAGRKARQAFDVAAPYSPVSFFPKLGRAVGTAVTEFGQGFSPAPTPAMDATQRAHADVMAGGVGNFTGGSIKPNLVVTEKADPPEVSAQDAMARSLGAVGAMKLHPEYVGADIRSGRGANGARVITGVGTGAPAPAGRTNMEIYQNERKVNQDYYDRRMSEEATNPAERRFYAGRYAASQAGDAAEKLARIQQETAKYGTDARSGDVRYGADAQKDLGFSKLKLDREQGAGTVKQADMVAALQEQLLAAKTPEERSHLQQLLQTIHPTKPVGTYVANPMGLPFHSVTGQFAKQEQG